MGATRCWTTSANSWASRALPSASSGRKRPGAKKTRWPIVMAAAPTLAAARRDGILVRAARCRGLGRAAASRRQALERHLHGRDALLDDVGQLVGEQGAALRLLRPEAAGGKEDAMADRHGGRANAGRG